MFAYISDFLSRHRRKFLYTGLTVGGFALLSKLAERKLLQWQEENATKVIQQQRRKTHYESTLNTTRLMMLQLMPNIRRVLEKELDADVLIQAIKDQPDKKRYYWDELKLIGFGRVVCSVVSVAFITPVCHVMMMIMAANTLSSAAACAEVQARYMASLQQLVETQLPDLVAKLQNTVKHIIGSLPITNSLTLPQLESILQQITLSLKTFSRDEPTSALPWKQYISPPQAIPENSEADGVLRDMHLTTVDIISTDDFRDVVNILIDIGVNYMLDELAEYYGDLQSLQSKHTSQTTAKPETAGEIKEKDLELADEKQSEPPSEESGVELNQSATGAIPKQYSPPPTLSVQTVSSVVVKLIPVMSSLLFKALPDAKHVSPSGGRNALYNRLVVCTQLEALAFNVYDALTLPQ